MTPPQSSIDNRQSTAPAVIRPVTPGPCRSCGKPVVNPPRPLPAGIDTCAYLWSIADLCDDCAEPRIRADLEYHLDKWAQESLGWYAHLDDPIKAEAHGDWLIDAIEFADQQAESIRQLLEDL